jgi:hypothetical protein
LVFGAEKASRDQAGRAPRWRLLEARRPGVDIIAGASLARRTVNLPSSIVKIRLWLPGRFVVARSAAVSKKCCPLRGDRGFESEGSDSYLKSSSVIETAYCEYDSYSIGKKYWADAVIIG